MGWLFGRKQKVPKVPFPAQKNPAGIPGDDNTLSFPKAPAGDKVIEPMALKKAAGVAPTSPPALPPMPQMPSTPKEKPAMPAPAQQAAPGPSPQPAPVVPQGGLGDPLYVKVDVYQRILGEFVNLKHLLTGLNDASNALDTSEYNEEKSFEKMKRSVKVLHDKMLEVDKIVYKAQGD